MTVLLAAVISLITISCGGEKFTPRADNRFLLGTVCILTLYEGESQEIYDEAFDLILKEEVLMSLQKGESDLARINGNAGDSPVEVSPDTYEVIKTALGYSFLSGGAFDPTIAPLVQLWGIGEDSVGTVPPQNLIDEKKALTDYRKVVLGENDSVFLEDKGMEIDLGGIAKGYIADKVRTFLQSKGVNRGIINLGGNIIVLGSKPGDEPWKIGIQDPFDSRGNYIGIASVKDSTVVTSGIYERYFISEGKRFHHILDPVTGYPVENDLASVTILSRSSIDADALSTSLFVLGVEKGMALIETIGDAEAVFVTKDRKVIESSGAPALFELQLDSYSAVSLEEYRSTSSLQQ